MIFTDSLIVKLARPSLPLQEQPKPTAGDQQKLAAAAAAAAASAAAAVAQHLKEGRPAPATAKPSAIKLKPVST